jgi:hypothetical protein
LALRNKMPSPLYLTLAFILIGLALLVASWIDRADGWTSGVLIEFGATLLLFAPLVWIGRLIEQQLDKLGAAQRRLEESQTIATERISDLSTELAETKERLRSVEPSLPEDLLATKYRADAELFRNVDTAANPGAAIRALRRALDLGIVSNPLQVDIPTESLHAEVALTPSRQLSPQDRYPRHLQAQGKAVPEYVLRVKLVNDTGSSIKLGPVDIPAYESTTFTWGEGTRFGQWADRGRRLFFPGPIEFQVVHNLSQLLLQRLKEKAASEEGRKA